VIEQVGRELLEPNEDGLEQVEGHRVVELLATTPIASAEEPGPTGEQDSDQRYSATLQVGQLMLCCSSLEESAIHTRDSRSGLLRIEAVPLWRCSTCISEVTD
jgi:hypothetical protein